MEEDPSPSTLDTADEAKPPAATTTDTSTMTSTAPLMCRTTDSLVSLTAYQRGQLAHMNSWSFGLLPSDAAVTSSPQAGDDDGGTDDETGKVSASKDDDSKEADRSKHSNARNRNHLTLESARSLLIEQVTLMREEEVKSQPSTQPRQHVSAVSSSSATASSPPRHNKDREDVRKAVLGSASSSASKRRKHNPSSTASKKDAKFMYDQAVNTLERRRAEYAALELQRKSYEKSGDQEVVRRLQRRMDGLTPGIQAAQNQMRTAQSMMRQQPHSHQKPHSRTSSLPGSIATGGGASAHFATTRPGTLQPPSPIVATKRRSLPEPPPHAQAKSRIVQGLMASANRQDEETRKALRAAAVNRYSCACSQYTDEQAACHAAEQAMIRCLTNGDDNELEATEQVRVAKERVAAALREKDAAEQQMRECLRQKY